MRNNKIILFILTVIVAIVIIVLFIIYPAIKPQKVENKYNYTESNNSTKEYTFDELYEMAQRGLTDEEIISLSDKNYKMLVDEIYPLLNNSQEGDAGYSDDFDDETGEETISLETNRLSESDLKTISNAIGPVNCVLLKGNIEEILKNYDIKTNSLSLDKDNYEETIENVYIPLLTDDRTIRIDFVFATEGQFEPLFKVIDTKTGEQLNLPSQNN